MTARSDTEPLDIATMRATVDRLLDPDSAPDVLPPAGEELAELIATMRSHLEQIAPEVEAAAIRLPVKHPHRNCAFACVGEARQKLRISVEHVTNPEVTVALARKLARSLHALCEHYDHLEHIGSAS